MSANLNSASELSATLVTDSSTDDATLLSGEADAASAKAVAAEQTYQRIAVALDYLLDRQLEQPSLAELAAQVGMSESHLQRTFSDWVGVSPKKFLQFITKEKAKRLLDDTTVLDAAYQSGLSSCGRLHDLMVQHESVTPGEYKSRGEGLAIAYAKHPCQFGWCFIATTSRGICKLAFFDELAEYQQQVAELESDWSNAVLTENPAQTQPYFDAVFARDSDDTQPVKLLLKGSPFRLQVWEALLRIPVGQVVSYRQVAHSIGKPESVRAVASAIASNEIGFLIPCHRVIRESGQLSDYRWGRSRKVAMLGFEQLRTEPSEAPATTKTLS